MRPGQCVIIIRTGLLSLIHGRLLMDNFFVALRRTDTQANPTFVPSVFVCGSKDVPESGSPAGGSLWLTRSIIQGDTKAVAGSALKSGTGLSVFSAAGLAAYGMLHTANIITLIACRLRFRLKHLS